MAWMERPQSEKTPNPAVKFYEWSSNDKCLRYYDKEKQENVLVPLPFKFVILENYHTVKGWNDESESGIYSNEVLFTGTEELTVKSFKGGLIAKGIYKDIKQKVNASGGKYHRSIYIVDQNGDLANLRLKGSAVSAYSDFTDQKKGKYPYTKWDKGWAKITVAEELKKGSVNYSIPRFDLDKVIKDKEPLLKKVKILQDYMLEYLSRDDETPKRVNSAVDQYFENKSEEEDDDLPF